ncbi:T9SS type A sorting domain-containing protein [Chryseobacterium sp. RU37D]|uniref:T9SS type A sorting domain-containing protein n=1 Tax=Chryseobacterium sp. RU37D TaxID=1907397 RepID=UPI001E5388B4|nr:T9SS type A sorting domain-containing protein [Chryseobacterium sp. RU37D]
MSFDGRKVLESAKIENDNSINISGIPAGVYFINLKSGNLKSFSQKLIIEVV